MSICRCAHLKKHSLLFSKTRNCPHARTADCLIAYCSMMKEEKGHLQPMVEPKTPCARGAHGLIPYISQMLVWPAGQGEGGG